MELTRLQRFNRAVQRYQLASETVKLEVFKIAQLLNRRILRRQAIHKVSTAHVMLAAYHRLSKHSTITSEDLMFICAHLNKVHSVQSQRPNGDVIEYLFVETKDFTFENVVKEIKDYETFLIAKQKRMLRRRANLRYHKNPEKYNAKVRERRERKRLELERERTAAAQPGEPSDSGGTDGETQ